MLNRLMQIGLTRWRYLGLCLSLLLSLACFWILLSKGLHLGLDFTGGVLLELKIQTLQSAAELNARLSPALAAILEVQPAGAPGEWLIKLPTQELITPAAELAQRLSSELDVAVELTRT
ncbi:MAG: protein translocase subunit SecF, partial [Aeromonadaceae bacterium]